MNAYKNDNETTFQRISYLFNQYEQKRSTAKEQKELFQWLNNAENTEIIKEYFIENLSNQPLTDWNKKEWDPMAQQILHYLPIVPTPQQGKRVSFPYRLAIAATLIGLLIAVIWLTTNDQNRPQKSLVQIQQPKIDLLPGSNVATLTLADGSKISLNNATNGQLSIQGNTQVIKQANGQLSYISNKPSPNSTVTYNTLSTPKGGQYQIQLPDGTKVWLNAASSITYPTSFTSTERKITIAGEAYFDIAKNKNQPFRVIANNINVEVLGTQFNINAYPDEPSIKTTLIEGSVKIATHLLKPGQAYENGKITPTNIAQDIAWKNGIFNFNNKNLEQIMRQLSRWYDLEVIYPQGAPKIEFGGELKRNLNLSQILKILEKSGVQFQLEGRRLTVKPYST